jgi:hypothetical protein
MRHILCQNTDDLVKTSMKNFTFWAKNFQTVSAFFLDEKVGMMRAGIVSTKTA